MKNIINQTDIVQIQESEYDANRGVAVIDKTRAMVATTVCSAIGTVHWGNWKIASRQED